MTGEGAGAAIGDYRHDHTTAWAEKIASFDGYVFVTPEVQPLDVPPGQPPSERCRGDVGKAKAS